MSAASAVPPAPDSPGPRPARHPVPWAATGLSLLVPGAGHVYAGRPVLGAAVWVGFVLVGMAVPIGLTASPNAVAFAGVLATFGAVYVIIAVHAWTVARDHRVATPTSRWTLAILVLGFLAAATATGGAATRLVGRHIASAYRVASPSMEPGVLVGDWVIATPSRRAPEHDRIVIYRQDGDSYIKRAVGIAGDTLEMRERRLFRNGAPVPEPYTFHDRPNVGASAATWGPLPVPAGHVFVLGDNRNHARDSRHFGFVDVDSVIGYPACIYFSRDPGSGAIRWRRIGRRFR